MPSRCQTRVEFLPFIFVFVLDTFGKMLSRKCLVTYVPKILSTLRCNTLRPSSLGARCYWSQEEER